MSCQTTGWNASLAGLCLEAVQQRLGLPTCGASAIAAWQSCYQHVGTPQPNDLVFFSAGASNAGFGHVGIVQPDTSTFWSELSNGSQAVCGINDFAAANGVSVLGYADVGQAKANIGPSVASGLSSLTASGPAGLAFLGGVVLGLWLLDDVLEAL